MPVVIHEFGPPDVLKYEDIADPEPREGEIRISIHAATVNRVRDVSLRAGKKGRRGPVLPLIPGVDCAGVVDAIGPGVSRWAVGQATCRLSPGAFRTLRNGGRHVTAGAHGGPEVPIDFPHLYQKKITIMGRTGRTQRDVANKASIYTVIDRIVKSMNDLRRGTMAS